MIILNEIKKSYIVGEHVQDVLKGINLTIQDGEMVSIQGRSGAGKSTLLHIMACLEKSDYGKYCLDDVEIGSLNDEKTSKMRNQKIGIILQDYVLIDQKSVLFNVMLPMYFNKTPYFKMKPLALEALETVGLKDMYRKTANKLSGGERQRVAIARAIINKPQIILADEPTGALDSVTGKEIMRLLKEINKAGTTVIIVTHDDSIAMECSRRFYMTNGLLTES